VTAEQAAGFAVFSLVAAGTPGPSNAVLTATGARAGVGRGLPALLGVAAGMGVLMFAVGFGLGTVLLGDPILSTGVRWCGVAVLCWLAWKIATAAPAGVTATGGRPIGFLGATALQWVNPKSWLVCASAAATFLDRGAGGALGQSAVFGLIFGLVSLPVCFLWLAGGAVLRRRLRTERAGRVFNGVMGALLAASVILILR
jgi:threonine/homoserine/homoserine lactone efflux protein